MPRMRAASATAAADLGLGVAPVAQAEGHVLEHRHVGVERVVLEDHRDVAVLGLELVDQALADPDLAAGDLLEAGDHAQGRALAAARGPDQHDELAIGDREVDAGDRGHRAIALAQPPDRYRRHPFIPLGSLATAQVRFGGMGTSAQGRVSMPAQFRSRSDPAPLALGHSQGPFGLWPRVGWSAKARGVSRRGQRL